MNEPTNTVSPSNEGVKGGVLNLRQLAEHLGCHRDTARITTRQESFPVGWLIGRRRYWPLSAVEQFFQNQSSTRE